MKCPTFTFEEVAEILAQVIDGKEVSKDVLDELFETVPSKSLWSATQQVATSRGVAVPELPVSLRTVHELSPLGVIEVFLKSLEGNSPAAFSMMADLCEMLSWILKNFRKVEVYESPYRASPEVLITAASELLRISEQRLAPVSKGGHHVTGRTAMELVFEASAGVALLTNLVTRFTSLPISGFLLRHTERATHAAKNKAKERSRITRSWIEQERSRDMCRGPTKLWHRYQAAIRQGVVPKISKATFCRIHKEWEESQTMV
jgi:hypothetical protein